MPPSPIDIERLKTADPGAVARAISTVESGGPEADALLAAIFPETGKAHRIGFAGPPGAGKSTLLARLIPVWVEEGRRVGVAATDPTSPLTGGAVLGDRARLAGKDLGTNVFFRSLASRGATGGLAGACRDVLRVMEAAGYDPLVAETVGVGQIETGIAQAVDTVVVVLVPESGDTIQTIKAGLLEFADILVVNKSDRPGADTLRTELYDLARSGDGAWEIPVLATSPLRGEGIVPLREAIGHHREHLRTSGEGTARRRRQAEAELAERVLRRLRQKLEGDETYQGKIDSLVRSVTEGTVTPIAAAADLLRLARERLGEDG